MSQSVYQNVYLVFKGDPISSGVLNVTIEGLTKSGGGTMPIPVAPLTIPFYREN
ncbi:hypothetical protein O9H85_21415 [Paenibacillus filicis]|uniref:DUF4183 domain-containing protein n=1 Tax=Paenibacillus gyeongsangnamensis TaxID=3388067 RepID=A0ABT4QDK6_9BACL|nr:hypothetical protein [Paenibacillus filicis]MCZ8514934.1 hypothetical protein [Paenibacillus filicis]